MTGLFILCKVKRSSNSRKNNVYFLFKSDLFRICSEQQLTQNDYIFSNIKIYWAS